MPVNSLFLPQKLVRRKKRMDFKTLFQANLRRTSIISPPLLPASRRIIQAIPQRKSNLPFFACIAPYIQKFKECALNRRCQILLNRRTRVLIGGCTTYFERKKGEGGKRQEVRDICNYIRRGNFTVSNICPERVWNTY